MASAPEPSVGAGAEALAPSTAALATPVQQHTAIASIRRARGARGALEERGMVLQRMGWDWSEAARLPALFRRLRAFRAHEVTGRRLRAGEKHSKRQGGLCPAPSCGP